MEYIEGGVTAAKGFKASSAAAGIKSIRAYRYSHDLQRCTMCSCRHFYNQHCKGCSGEMG